MELFNSTFLAFLSSCLTKTAGPLLVKWMTLFMPPLLVLVALNSTENLNSLPRAGSSSSRVSWLIGISVYKTQYHELNRQVIKLEKLKRFFFVFLTETYINDLIQPNSRKEGLKMFLNIVEIFLIHFIPAHLPDDKVVRIMRIFMKNIVCVDRNLIASRLNSY